MPYTQEYLMQKAQGPQNFFPMNSSAAVYDIAKIPEAHRPEQRGSIWSWLSDQAANATEQAKDIISNATNPDENPPSGSYKRQEIVYQDADLAAAYGMNAATAYQEALSNTAHQREVADLRAAGLNPVLSATQGRGAGTVSSAEAAAASGGASNSSASFMEAVRNLKSVLQVARLAKQIF